MWFVCHVGQLCDIFWYFWTWNMSIHIQKINMLQREILEARFWAPTQIVHANVSECPAKISNVRPRSRTSGRDLEHPAEISNIWPRFRMSGRPIIKNVQSEFRMLEPWNAGKVQTSITFCVFGILGTMNRMKAMNWKRGQQPQHRPPSTWAGGQDDGR